MLKHWLNHSFVTRFIRFVLLWIYSTAFWIPLATVHLSTRRKLISERNLSHLIHFWGRTSLWLLGIQIQAINPERVTEAQPRVMMTNHQSGLDVLWGAATCPARVLVIGKKEVIFVPILNIIWLALDFIFIDRKNSERAKASLEGVAQRINRDLRTLVIAPEGTRTADGTLGPFKKGGFHIAIEAQAPLYPTVVKGAFELLAKNEWLPRPGKIEVHFLAPLSTTGKTVQDIPELMTSMHQVMSLALKN